MKVWYVKATDPKPRDRRKSWFYTLYTVHAETANGARADVEDLMRFGDKATVVSVKECRSTILDTRIFDAQDKDLRK